MLKVGLLGAGRIAGVHATAITTNPGSTLVAVSDINTEAAAKLAAQYGAEARTTDAILNDPAIDAVLSAARAAGVRTRPEQRPSTRPSTRSNPCSAPTSRPS